MYSFYELRSGLVEWRLYIWLCCWDGCYKSGGEWEYDFMVWRALARREELRESLNYLISKNARLRQSSELNQPCRMTLDPQKWILPLWSSLLGAQTTTISTFLLCYYRVFLNISWCLKVALQQQKNLICNEISSIWKQNVKDRINLILLNR